MTFKYLTKPQMVNITKSNENYNMQTNVNVNPLVLQMQTLC